MSPLCAWPSGETTLVLRGLKGEETTRTTRRTSERTQAVLAAGLLPTAAKAEAKAAGWIFRGRRRRDEINLRFVGHVLPFSWC